MDPIEAITGKVADIVATVQRFRPRPGDMFVITMPKGDPRQLLDALKPFSDEYGVKFLIGSHDTRIYRIPDGSLGEVASLLDNLDWYDIDDAQADVEQALALLDTLRAHPVCPVGVVNAPAEDVAELDEACRLLSMSLPLVPASDLMIRFDADAGKLPWTAAVVGIEHAEGPTPTEAVRQLLFQLERVAMTARDAEITVPRLEVALSRVKA